MAGNDDMSLNDCNFVCVYIYIYRKRERERERERESTIKVHLVRRGLGLG